MKKLLLLVILFSFFLLQSCGNKDEKTEVKKDDKVTEESKPNDKNTASGDVKTDEKKDGDATGLGLTSGLPQDFPKDIPQPNNSKCNGFLGSSDGTVVTFESKDNLKSILEFYKTEMGKNGYKSQEGNEYFQNENGAMLGFKKGDKEVGFLLGIDKEKNVTQIVITYK
jgi:hypothetical protein